MEFQHINIKLFVENQERIEQEKFTPIFQRWIQEQNCPELLIDVADYLHVPAGPGIVLVAHEADYSMDNSDSRLGLRYNRKTEVKGDDQARITQALSAALTACQRLEGDPLMGGKLKFARQEIQIFVNDRALAPNNEESLAKFRPILEGYFKTLLGDFAPTFQFETDARKRLGVTLKTSKPFDLEALAKKIP